jgi:RNA polymerase sigma-70 factor (ECF subfamily)
MGGDVHSAEERAAWLATHVLRHEPGLRSWLRQRCVEGIEIDDIIQETYSRLIGLESVDQIRNIRNYMFQAAHSVLVSYIRRSKVVDLQAVSDIETLAVIPDELSPEAHAIGRDELRRLARAIAQMPARVQEVFIARRIRGLSQREAATELGLSENTIEKYMCRSIILLGKLFLCDGNDGARASTFTSPVLSEHENRRENERFRTRN